MLAEEYIEKWAKPNKKSWRQDKRTLDVEVIPKWGKRKARDIRRREVVLLLEGIAKRAPVMANRTRALLSKLFNFALEREIVETNPCTGVKPSVKEKAVERNLSEEEIREVWQALSTPGVWRVAPETARCLKLILLTGQRPGEVVEMHSGEIDGQWWTIPDPKNGIAQPSRQIPLHLLFPVLCHECATLSDEFTKRGFHGNLMAPKLFGNFWYGFRIW